jgi:hypothetical protein
VTHEGHGGVAAAARLGPRRLTPCPTTLCQCSSPQPPSRLCFPRSRHRRRCSLPQPPSRLCFPRSRHRRRCSPSTTRRCRRHRHRPTVTIAAAAAASSHSGEGSPRRAVLPQGASHPVRLQHCSPNTVVVPEASGLDTVGSGIVELGEKGK